MNLGFKRGSLREQRAVDRTAVPAIEYSDGLPEALLRSLA